MSRMKFIVIISTILFSQFAVSQEKNSDSITDKELLKDATNRLFDMAISLQEASIIKDSNGCLWGLNKNKSGVPTLIRLLNEKGKKQLCR